MSGTYVSTVGVSLGNLELLIHFLESLEPFRSLQKVVEEFLGQRRTVHGYMHIKHMLVS